MGLNNVIECWGRAESHCREVLRYIFNLPLCLIVLIAVTGQFKNIKEVQNDLMGFINADTILVGHGLENDLRALNLIHGTILDTAVVFPHFNGLPFRRSLRSLVSSYLKRDIQVITPPPRPLVTCHHI